MRYLAIDFGVKRYGLAVSDESGLLASPVGTRERRGTKADVAAVIETLRGMGAQRVLFGLPRGLGTAPGQHEAAARRFAEAIQEGLRAAGLADEIVWWDERFSTSEAKRGMRDAGISERRGRESGGTDSVDARAAAVILQGFLDAQRTAVPDTLLEIEEEL